jgi:flagellum-specific peptidoglycan hydrolase FlgJ
MELSDLFVSYKQVTPVKFEFDAPTLPQPIYLNADRAKKALSEESEDMSSWKADENSDMKTWSVRSASPSSSPEVQVENTSSDNGSVVSRWNSIYAGNQQRWISDMKAAYKRAGLNDSAIKNLIAKNALESGWGTTAQGSFNFGNITTGRNWKGKYVKGRDHDADGNRITHHFRAYDSLDDYVADEIQFLTKLYDFNQNDNFDTFINKLQGGNSGKRKYAEDRQYASKVRNVFNSI